MSMISEQVKALRDLARINSGDTFNLLWGAANTIEDLSAKVRANNLHGGWIPVSERVPDEAKVVLACNKNGIMMVGQIFVCHNGECQAYTDDDEMDWVIAWMELPEPYKAGESNADE